MTPDLLAGFLDEAPEYLEMLDAGLTKFKSQADGDGISLDSPEDQKRTNTMFCAAHSLKGLAAAFEFKKIKELTQRVETYFDRVRMGQAQLTGNSIETLFRVFDCLKLLVKELSGAPAGPVDIQDLLTALDTLLDVVKKESWGPAPGGEELQAPTQPRQTECQYDILNDPELAAVFFETVAEAVDDLNQGLLGLEDNPSDTELLNKVFRAAHNIKGATGAVGLTGMNRLTHDLETVFDHMRCGRLTFNEALANAAFRVADRLREVLDRMRENRIEDVHDGEMRGLFDEWVKQDDMGKSAPSGAAKPEVSGEAVAPSVAALQDAIREPAGDTAPGVGDGRLSVTVRFSEGFNEASIQAFLIQNKLHDLGTVHSSEPDLDRLDGDTPLTTISFTVTTEADAATLERIISIYNIESVTVTGGGVSSEAGMEPPPPSGMKTGEKPNAAETTPQAASAGASPGSTPPPPPPGAKRNAAATVVKATETLRVDQERLDQLMNLGGELVINRARFTQIHGRFREVFHGKNLGYLVDDIDEHLGRLQRQVESLDGRQNGHEIQMLTSDLAHLQKSFSPVRSLIERVRDLRSSMVDFDEAVHGLARVSKDIQKGIMGTRMVPIGPLFTRFRRVVRDLCKSTGKQINLVLRGENTELDKRMIDELGDPLTHMVRNSVDHGIEKPDAREKAGKNRVGTLTLEACHRGNSICVEVIDDGGGINLERIKAKILERALASPAQVADMTERELIQYVLKAGFSTAETVTEVSGRGVGMDIVVNKIEKLSGTIEVCSTFGQGTRVTIKLPLTLAILTSMVARIGEGIYALPLEAVAEIVTVRRSEIHHVQRREIVRLRERIIPLGWFEDIFATHLPSLQTTSRNADKLTLVVIGSENDKIGLVVDELLGQEDVVIKSLAENYRNVRGIAGASIRGDGRVSLILDVAAMMEMAAEVSMEGSASKSKGRETHAVPVPASMTG